MQAGRLDADTAYGVGTVTNGSRWSSAVDRQTGATGADMGDAALLSYGRGLEQAHPSTGASRRCAPRPPGAGAGRCGAALLSYGRGLELARRRHSATGAGPAARAWVAPPLGCSLG